MKKILLLLGILLLLVSCSNSKDGGKTEDSEHKITESVKDTDMEGNKKGTPDYGTDYRVVKIIKNDFGLNYLYVVTKRSKNGDEYCGGLYAENECLLFLEGQYHVDAITSPLYLGKIDSSLSHDSDIQFLDETTLEINTGFGDGGSASITKITFDINTLKGKEENYSVSENDEGTLVKSDITLEDFYLEQ